MARVAYRLAALGGRDLRSADVVVAACLAVVAVVLLSATRHPYPATLLGALGACPVATRRRAPHLSILAVAACSALIGLADPGTSLPTQAAAGALCFYTLGCRSGRRLGGPTDVALLALVAGIIAVSPRQGALDVTLGWIVFALLPFLAGLTVVRRRARTVELRAAADRAREEQEAQAQSAAAEERTRIARELHDIIAHGLTVMVIQTAAAREVAPVDASSARAALAAVQVAGREAMLEMRRIVGVLRHGEAEHPWPTAPGLDQLDLLAERARMSGLAVTLAVNGRRRALPDALGLVIFRVVQEALTNSMKHSGAARATVDVTFHEDALEVDIRDDGRGPSGWIRGSASGGHGLVGMRERVAMFEGELSAGGQSNGGFRVHARIPIDGAVAA